MRVCGWFSEEGVIRRRLLVGLSAGGRGGWQGSSSLSRGGFSVWNGRSSLGVGGIVRTGWSRGSVGASSVGAHGSIASWRSSMLWG
eukprot:16434577-Heterocapsa_arctica.AAC.1